MSVAAGKYWLSAQAPGHILPGSSYDITGKSGWPLDVVDGQKIENIVLEIKRGSVITGRITDSRGAPMTGEVIQLRKFDKSGRLYFTISGHYFCHSCVTDDRGVYRANGLPEGRYLVSVGYDVNNQVFYPGVTRESEAKVIEVSEESEVTDIDITLPNRKPGPILPERLRGPNGEEITNPDVIREILTRAGVIPKPRTDGITVRLVTKDGTDLPKAKVELFPVTEDGRRTSNDSRSNITDEDGSFKFREYEPKSESGLYSIIISDARGYVPTPTPINDGQNPIYRFRGDNITIPMIKGGVITGKILNATGEPVVGAYISVMMIRDAQEDPISANIVSRPIPTDDRGVYRFHGLYPGTYVVFTKSNIVGPLYCSDAKYKTYHPSSTRVTATEVTVRSGVETGGVDIRYREDRSPIK